MHYGLGLAIGAFSIVFTIFVVWLARGEFMKQLRAQDWTGIRTSIAINILALLVVAYLHYAPHL